jgi:subtilisin family serine protease
MAQQQMVKRLVWLLGGLGISLAGAPVFALVHSVGEAGIDARRLHEDPYSLTGEKIAIGQVEIGRPGRFGLDKAAANNLVVKVTQLFFRDGPARANDLVDGHATNVASVMISTDKYLTGVAPDAQLFSSAVGMVRRNGQPQECLASQTVALQNGGDVRATNFSFGESLAQDPRPEPVLDGNALLTQCVDWSASTHDVLYVIAGNQGRGGIPIPTDNFNGVNVANSTQVDGQFVKVDFSNLGSDAGTVIGRDPATESNVGPRRSISLVAPGTNVEMINPDGSMVRATGTSFAAPHVTATVALMQEYGDRQIRANERNWSVDARRHEVMKAILMNSADKVKDTGDGLNLGMTRTVVTQSNRNWLDSDAYRDRKIPLDNQLGTGHLNAYRAYQQFSPGQWSPEAAVPAIGWDYRTVASNDEAPEYRDYVFEQPLQAGSFVSATLAWDRKVNLQDQNQNELFEVEEAFEDQGLNNLDIYLMPAEENDVDDSIWSSVSEVDSVEHIFHRVPETGRYKIRVVYRDRVHDAVQPYAFAWWTMPAR